MPGGMSYAPAWGNGSLVTNGQIVPVPMTGQYFPSMASAPFYTGNGQPPPTVPINFMSGAGSMGSSQAGNAPSAASDPFSFTQSPLIMSIIFLVVGIAGLRYIHWRG
jgi:hypothetical protein